MTRNAIRSYIEESCLIKYGETVTPETDLFEAQIIDSFGFVELVTYLESTFAIKITDEDLLSQRLTSLNSIVALVQERINALSHS